MRLALLHAALLAKEGAAAEADAELSEAGRDLPEAVLMRSQLAAGGGLAAAAAAAIDGIAEAELRYRPAVVASHVALLEEVPSQGHFYHIHYA